MNKRQRQSVDAYLMWVEFQKDILHKNKVSPTSDSKQPQWSFVSKYGAKKAFEESEKFKKLIDERKQELASSKNFIVSH